MAATSISTPSEALPGIPIGPRLRAELERRVRELECRFKPAPRDMRELAQLREFLKVTPITERDGRERSARPPLTTPNGFVGVRHG
jgi:hypothetical protein